MMKIIYWVKITVFCEYPFHQEVSHREIHFYTTKKKNYKKKLDFVCDSQVVGKDRIEAVAKHLNISHKKLKLIQIK